MPYESVFTGSIAMVVADLRARGFACELEPTLGGYVRCETCLLLLDAHEATVDEVHRAWDLDDGDAQVVVAARWASCQGALVLGCGPTASSTDEALLAALNVA